MPPDDPDRPIIDAAIAFARAIVNATVRVINAGVQLFAAAVDVTAQMMRGLTDSGVCVRGLAQATVATSDDITLVPPMGFEPTLPP